MPMKLTIRESHYGLWCICSGSSVLFDALRFAQSIRLARGLAREQHVSTGRTVCVEMSSTEFTIPLAQFDGSSVSSGAAQVWPANALPSEQGAMKA